MRASSDVQRMTESATLGIARDWSGIKTEDLAASIAFYERELKNPAARRGAPDDLVTQRAAAASGLTESIATAHGLGAARTFYRDELRAPAERPEATPAERINRAVAAFNLLAAHVAS